jgi:hypothetical protein
MAYPPPEPMSLNAPRTRTRTRTDQKPASERPPETVADGQNPRVAGGPRGYGRGPGAYAPPHPNPSGSPMYRGAKKPNRNRARRVGYRVTLGGPVSGLSLIFECNSEIVCIKTVIMDQLQITVGEDVFTSSVGTWSVCKGPMAGTVRSEHVFGRS